MTEDIQVWRMYPSLRGCVEFLQLWEVIIHKKIQRKTLGIIHKAKEEIKTQENQIAYIEALKKHL
jgi:hypothetical protein